MNDTPPSSPDSAVPVWLELRVTAPLEAQEAVSGFLWDLGVQGITEEATARAGEAWVLLRAYVESAEAEALKAQVRAHLEAIDEFFPGARFGRISVSQVEQKDWNAAWKEHFKPIQVSPRIVIRPSWEPYTARAGEVVVDIDPGMAFGTGTHESTRGCLQAIDALFGGGGLPVRPFEAAVEVLDVGTGSGILLIAALKLGGRGGVGVDLDPLAVTAATENCERNGQADRVRISDTLVQDIPGRYPLVLANILASTLIELAGALAERVAEGGVVVLSWLLTEQANAVLAR